MDKGNKKDNLKRNINDKYVFNFFIRLTME